MLPIYHQFGTLGSLAKCYDEAHGAHLKTYSGDRLTKTLFVLPSLLSILIFTHCKAAKFKVVGDRLSTLKTKDLVSTQDVDRPLSVAANSTTIQWASMALSLTLSVSMILHTGRLNQMRHTPWSIYQVRQKNLHCSLHSFWPVCHSSDCTKIWGGYSHTRKTTSDALWRDVHNLINRRSILLIFHR